MPIKVMLHPSLAPTLPHAREHIDSNCAGFVSWERLTDVMKASGNLLTGESIEAFVLTDDGIQFFTRRV